MDRRSQLIAILRNDPLRWHLLDVVRSLNLPDGWIGAGFVRNAVWDYLHGRPAARPSGDVDVIWYDPRCTEATEDREQERALRALEPGIAWSVKNQARMHHRNGDAPYASAVDAMRSWPETATAVAVRRTGTDDYEVAAPLGLEDLMQLVLRPTPRFAAEKHHIYDDRVCSKGWLQIWPLLREQRVQAANAQGGADHS